MYECREKRISVLSSSVYKCMVLLHYVRTDKLLLLQVHSVLFGLTYSIALSEKSNLLTNALQRKYVYIYRDFYESNVLQVDRFAAYVLYWVQIML